MGVDIVSNGSDAAQQLVENGYAVIGTPRDAIRQLKRLWKQSGGFGCFLLTDLGWTHSEQTCHSLELFADKVIPTFKAS